MKTWVLKAKSLVLYIKMGFLIVLMGLGIGIMLGIKNITQKVRKSRLGTTKLAGVFGSIKLKVAGNKVYGRFDG